VLGIFGISILFIWLLLKIYEIYSNVESGLHLELSKDLDDERYGDAFWRQIIGSEWKKGMPIWVLLVSRIFLTLFFILIDLPLLFLFIMISFLDYLDNRFIALIKNNTWKVLDFFASAICYTIILSSYLDLLWVIISVIGYWMVFVFVYWDLDYIQLKAYIPDILAILSFYGDPVYHVWVLPVALVSFLYSFYIYSLM
jgi:hypothetical protein